jgi:DNA-directed RNA polymerase subunit RPC12/RpoP
MPVYEKCVDCGTPKTTFSQRRSPRCNACAGKQKRADKGEYYTHCIDCGAEKPLGTSRRHPRCTECGYKYLTNRPFYDTCQECGEPKPRNKSGVCRSCFYKRRARERREEAEERQRAITTYDHCQVCGAEKADTTRPLCKSCSITQSWDTQRERVRTLYDTCQECGQPKGETDRELCPSCAGIKRMTELMGNEDREYPIGWCKTLREKIRDRDHRRCVLCGKTEKENGRKLDVHHIDGDKDNLDEHNLISLCLVCHGKTRWNPEFWAQVLPLHFRKPKQDWQRKVVVTAPYEAVGLPCS